MTVWWLNYFVRSVACLWILILQMGEMGINPASPSLRTRPGFSPFWPSLRKSGDKVPKSVQKVWISYLKNCFEARKKQSCRFWAPHLLKTKSMGGFQVVVLSRHCLVALQCFQAFLYMGSMRIRCTTFYLAHGTWIPSKRVFSGWYGRVGDHSPHSLCWITLPETNIAPTRPIFRGYVSFREAKETAQIDVMKKPMKFPWCLQPLVFPAAFSAQSPLGLATARVETSGERSILTAKNGGWLKSLKSRPAAMAYNECATRKKWTGSQISRSYWCDTRIHLFLFTGTMKMMNTLQLVFVLMIPQVLSSINCFKTVAIFVSTRQNLRSEMAQHLREDGIPIDPWLHGWRVDVERWSKWQPFFLKVSVKKKMCASKHLNFAETYIIQLHFSVQIRFFMVLWIFWNCLINPRRQTSGNLTMRCESPRTFSSAPQLDLSLFSRWKLSCWWLWGCNYCIALIEQDQLFCFEWNEWVELMCLGVQYLYCRRSSI